MRDPDDIRRYPEKAKECLEEVEALLAEFIRQWVLVDTYLGPGRPCPGRTRHTHLEATLINEARIEFSLAKLYKNAIDENGGAGCRREMFRFFSNMFIETPYRIKGYRPSLSLKASPLRGRQGWGRKLIRDAKKHLICRDEEGVYFYADFQPYSQLRKSPCYGGNDAYVCFEELVDEIRVWVHDRKGWLQHLRGTDTIRGYIPDKLEALKFFILEIRRRTREHMRDDKNLYGWTIGAAHGASRILLGVNIPDAGENRDLSTFGNAARLMELGDEARHVVGGAVTVLCEQLGLLAERLFPDDRFRPIPLPAKMILKDGKRILVHEDYYVHVKL